MFRVLWSAWSASNASECFRVLRVLRVDRVLTWWLRAQIRSPPYRAPPRPPPRRWGEATARVRQTAGRLQTATPLPTFPGELLTSHLLLALVLVPCSMCSLCRLLLNGSRVVLVGFQVSSLAQRRTWIPIENSIPLLPERSESSGW